MSQERIYWLAWSKVTGVGPILVDRLYQQFGNLEAAWNAPDEKILQIEGVGTLSGAKILANRTKIDPLKLLAEQTIANPNWWARSDADYPRLLAEIPSAPGILYYQGQADTIQQSGDLTIGIVGTRYPSKYGIHWAREISACLAQNGFTIVSGMALGIDTEAHSACLEAGGRTIAVVGTGVDVVYPPNNRQLAADIQQQGLIVSEYPAGTQPARPHFPARNRIIAGLSRVTIVIEAPVKSGALITAYQANDFSRDVYVLPGAIDNPNAIGCLGLLSRGAQPILSLKHLLELLSAIPQLDSRQLQLPLTPEFVTPAIQKAQTHTILASSRGSANELAPDLHQIWVLLADDPIDFDTLVFKSQLPVATVSSRLLQLELLGAIVQLPGMRYQRC